MFSLISDNRSRWPINREKQNGHQNAVIHVSVDFCKPNLIFRIDGACTSGLIFVLIDVGNRVNLILKAQVLKTSYQYTQPLNRPLYKT